MDKPREHILRPGRTTIGRKSDSDIAIPDESASRLHAELHYDAEANVVTLRDLESTNGTFVNRERLTQPRVLRAGDQMRIGQHIASVAFRDLNATPVTAALSGTQPLTRDLLLESVEQHAILLYEVASRLNALIDLETALQEVARMIQTAMGAERCQVILAGHFDRLTELGFPTSIAHQAIEGRMTVVIPDLSTYADDSLAKSALLLHIRSVLCVPVLLSEEVVALIYIYKTDLASRPFDSYNVQLAVAISYQTALTIQRARLLQQAERRYRTLFEEAPVMYVITRNQAGIPVITDCNELFLGTLGYGRAEVLERPLADFYTPESRAALFEGGGYQQALSGHFVAQERQLLTREGRVVETLLQAVPEMDAEGRVVGTRAMYVDITERKRAEAALQDSEARYRAIVEDQTELICRYWPDGNLTFVNQAYCRYFGETAESLLGSKFELRVHPEDQAVVARKRAALSRQTPVVTYWCRVITPRGEVRWQQWTERALWDDHGQLVEFQAAGQDITERKQAEEAIKRHNEELRALNAIAAILRQTRDREPLLQAALDKTIEVLKAEGGWVYLLEENHPNTLGLIAHRGLSPSLAEQSRIIQLNEGWAAPTPSVTLSNRLTPILETLQLGLKASVGEAPITVDGVPLRSKERVLGMLAIYQTHRLGDQDKQLLAAIGHPIEVVLENLSLAEKAAENEILRKLVRLRSELVANVSHELRTPLGLIAIACTTLLREDVEFDRETQREFLRDIEEEAGKLEKIVDNLLDLSRMQSGRMRLEKLPTDLGQLSRDTLDAMQVQLAQHRLVCDFPSSPLVAMAETKRIEQVLRNLLGNAGKYSPPGTSITIQGRLRGHEILVAVKDQGIGIPIQDLEKIFERFYRVRREEAQEAPGIGLGLAVCRGIVEAHGGRIWAESAPGKGSTFYFTLPIEEADAGMEIVSPE